MTVLINLIGEQPLPNLLPIEMERPNSVVLVHSDLTARVAKNLRKLIASEVISHEVDAYNIAETEAYLRELITEKEWSAQEILVNLTGGTKLMSLGAFRIANELGSRALYLRTEGRAAVDFYNFAHGSKPDKTIYLDTLPAILTLPDFVRVFRGDQFFVREDYAKTEPGRSFERAVHQALVGSVDDAMVGLKLDNAVDIDLVVRCGNEVALIECKIGRNGLKDAIDQLNTAGGREYLGTYTRKIVVSNVAWNEKTNLAALAQARRIHVIELPDYGVRDAALSDASAVWLRKEVERILGMRRPLRSPDA